MSHLDSLLLLPNKTVFCKVNKQMGVLEKPVLSCKKRYSDKMHIFIAQSYTCILDSKSTIYTYVLQYLISNKFYRRTFLKVYFIMNLVETRWHSILLHSIIVCHLTLALLTCPSTISWSNTGSPQLTTVCLVIVRSYNDIETSD